MTAALILSNLAWLIVAAGLLVRADRDRQIDARLREHLTASHEATVSGLARHSDQAVRHLVDQIVLLRVDPPKAAQRVAPEEIEDLTPYRSAVDDESPAEHERDD